MQASCCTRGRQTCLLTRKSLEGIKLLLAYANQLLHMHNAAASTIGVLVYLCVCACSCPKHTHTQTQAQTRAWMQDPSGYTSTCTCTHVHMQGAFVYELVGETTLPAPVMECRGVVPLEGPNHTFDVFFPFANTQVGCKALWHALLHHLYHLVGSEGFPPSTALWLAARVAGKGIPYKGTAMTERGAGKGVPYQRTAMTERWAGKGVPYQRTAMTERWAGRLAPRFSAAYASALL